MRRVLRLLVGGLCLTTVLPGSAYVNVSMSVYQGFGPPASCTFTTSPVTTSSDGIGVLMKPATCSGISDWTMKSFVSAMATPSGIFLGGYNYPDLVGPFGPGFNIIAEARYEGVLVSDIDAFADLEVASGGANLFYSEFRIPSLGISQVFAPLGGRDYHISLTAGVPLSYTLLAMSYVPGNRFESAQGMLAMSVRITAVPEPTLTLVFAAALAILFACRRLHRHVTHL